MKAKNPGRFHFQNKASRKKKAKKEVTEEVSFDDVEFERPSKITFDINDRDHFLKSIQTRKHEQRIVTKAIQRLAEEKRKKQERTLKNKIIQEQIENKGLLERKAKREEVQDIQASVERTKEKFQLQQASTPNQSAAALSHVEVDIQPISLRNDAYYASSSDEDEEPLEEKLERQAKEKALLEEKKQERIENLPEHLRKIYGIHKLDLDATKLTHLIQEEKERKKKKIDDRVKSHRSKSRVRTKSNIKHSKSHENRMKKVRARMGPDEMDKRKKKRRKMRTFRK